MAHYHIQAGRVLPINVTRVAMLLAVGAAGGEGSAWCQRRVESEVDRGPQLSNRQHETLLERRTEGEMGKWENGKMGDAVQRLYVTREKSVCGRW